MPNSSNLTAEKRRNDYSNKKNLSEFSYTDLPFVETHFRDSINGNGFPLKDEGFLLQSNFPQNLESCFQSKI